MSEPEASTWSATICSCTSSQRVGGTHGSTLNTSLQLATATSWPAGSWREMLESCLTELGCCRTSPPSDRRLSRVLLTFGELNTWTVTLTFSPAGCFDATCCSEDSSR